MKLRYFDFRSNHTFMMNPLLFWNFLKKRNNKRLWSNFQYAFLEKWIFKNFLGPFYKNVSFKSDLNLSSKEGKNFLLKITQTKVDLWLTSNCEWVKHFLQKSDPYKFEVRSFIPAYKEVTQFEIRFLFYIFDYFVKEFVLNTKIMPNSKNELIWAVNLWERSQIEQVPFLRLSKFAQADKFITRLFHFDIFRICMQKY